jgi:uncharacterized protein
MQENLGHTGLVAQLSGVPVMQLEIRNAVERDRLLYNSIGFLAGCLIAIAFFRRVSFMIIAAAPPLIAILLSLGTLGWLDFRLNMFLNVMTPLIMVISFSDSMQLTFAARDRLIAGEDKYQAFRNSVLIVGPACVLTHGVAALSFIALQFSNVRSDPHLRAGRPDRDRGRAGRGALAGPAARRAAGAQGDDLRGQYQGRRHRRRLSAPLLRLDRVRMVSRPGLYSLFSLIVVGGLAAVYVNLEPRYRLADQVPDKRQAVEASSRLDAKLTGANPIDVLIEFPQGASLYAPETLAAIAAVHSIVEKQAGVGNVWSLDSLRRWLAERAGRTDVETLKQYVDILPAHLTRRFVSAIRTPSWCPAAFPTSTPASCCRSSRSSKRRSTRCAQSRLPDLGHRPVRDRRAQQRQHDRAAQLRADHRDPVRLGFIGLAFRSVAVMFASILPGMFPVVLAGTVLWWMGEGLQFASVVALVVSFGLGLSATIHFLNRLRLEDRPENDPGVGVERRTCWSARP